MRVLIAGCGGVGARLALLLAREGHEVFALRRRAGLPPMLAAAAGKLARAPHIHAVQADLARAETLRALPRALGAVVFSPTPDTRDADGYTRTYIHAARNLLAQITKSAARPRWLHLSSTAVYAENNGGWVTENSRTEAGGQVAAPQPSRPRGARLPSETRRALLLGSEAVARDGGIPCVVLRLAGLYGPGRTGMLRRAQAFRAGEVTAARRFTNRIHLDDAAGAAAHLLQHRAPEAVYIGADCAPTLETEVLEWLAGARSAHLPARIFAVAQSRDGENAAFCAGAQNGKQVLWTGAAESAPAEPVGHSSIAEEAAPAEPVGHSSVAENGAAAGRRAEGRAPAEPVGHSSVAEKGAAAGRRAEGRAPAEPVGHSLVDAAGATNARGVAGKRCSNARLLQSGYRFRFPDFRAGYASLLSTD